MSSDLIKGVGACAPVSEHKAEPNRLDAADENADGHGVQRALLQEDLRDQLEEEERRATSQLFLHSIAHLDFLDVVGIL